MAKNTAGRPASKPAAPTHPVNPALEAAVIAHAEDDTPRLVYADWLDENGDPDRAAFIRRQVEFARLPEWDPVRLRAECLDYGNVHGANRPKPLPDGIPWGDWPFRRGFPAAISTSKLAVLVKRAKELSRLAPIEELEVFGHTSRGPLNLKPLTDSLLLSCLRRLTFSIATLNRTGLDLLLRSRRTARLTELSFVSSSNPGGSFTQLFRSSLILRLERLEIALRWDDNYDVLDAIQKVRGPARLRGLMLMGSDTDPHPALLGEPDFYASPLLENLTDLNLMGGNRMTRVEVGLLLQAPFLDRIESLDLGRAYLGAAAQALFQSPRLQQLRRLNLAGNRLTAKVAQALAESPHLTNLRVLDLSANLIGDVGAKAIAKSPHLTGLLDLDLSHSGVRDAGAKAFADSPLADTLIRLNLEPEGAGISANMKRKLQERFGQRVRV
jgi:uncharacterized protein (TIGR02996 family)